MHNIYFRNPIRICGLALIFSILTLSVTESHSHATPGSGRLENTVTAAGLACEKESSSVAAYSILRQQAPHLFKHLGDWRKGEITILTEPHQLCEVQEHMRRKYAEKDSAAKAWAGSRAGVVLQDPYVLVLREAVRFPNGKLGLYNRKVTRATLDGGVAGAFCLPLLADGRVIMVKEYRHQERRWRLSIPGGFRDDGEDAEQAARREATEETGYAMGELARLGDVDAEGEAVPLFVGPTNGLAANRSPDEGEALAGTIPLTLSELKKAVIASGFRDADGTWLSLHASLGSAVLMVENYLETHPLAR